MKNVMLLLIWQIAAEDVRRGEFNLLILWIDMEKNGYSMFQHKKIWQKNVVFS